MANLAVWLLALVTPVVRRVLIALGIGLVTYTGLDYALNGLRDAVINSLGGIPADVSGIAATLGIYESVSIALGAIATRLALTQLTKWGKT